MGGAVAAFTIQPWGFKRWNIGDFKMNLGGSILPMDPMNPMVEFHETSAIGDRLCKLSVSSEVSNNSKLHGIPCASSMGIWSKCFKYIAAWGKIHKQLVQQLC